MNRRGVAEVAHAEHPDDAVRTGKRRGPTHAVVAVVRLECPWLPISLGGEAAPSVLDHHDVAASDHTERVDGHPYRAGQVLAVAQTGQQHGPWAARRRPIYVDE